MTTKNNRQQSLPSWLVTGIVASLAVVYALFVFLPTQRKTSALKLKKYELIQYVANRLKTQEKIEQARRQQLEIEQVTLAWKQYAPRPGEVGRMLSSITQQARQAGVTLQRFDPQPQVPLQAVAQQPILVALEGDFSQVFDFLQRVESMPHRVWISNLTLSPATENGETLRAEMTLTIFADLAENAERANST